MAGKRGKAQRGDRATLVATGERATIMEVRTPKGEEPRYDVIPDVGLRRNVIWRSGDCTWDPPQPIVQCYRCGEHGHYVVSCPYGDCGYRLTEEARTAIKAAGLDPRRVPGPADAPDAYDGIRLFDAADRTPVCQPMRRRLCTVGDLVVDGHEPDADGACIHCGVLP